MLNTSVCLLGYIKVWDFNAVESIFATKIGSEQSDQRATSCKLVYEGQSGCFGHVMYKYGFLGTMNPVLK